MKSLYESILSKAGVGVVKRLSHHFEEIVNKYAHHIIVEQIEVYQRIDKPRSEKRFPHDSKVFDNVYKNLEKKLPVNKKDLFAEYYNKVIQQQHSFDGNKEYTKLIDMNIDRECEFALMYIFYIFYKLESTNIFKLQQHGRKAKILNQVIDEVNDEIGCRFMWRLSKSEYPESGMQFNFDSNALGFYGKDDENSVSVQVRWTSFVR